MRINVGIGTNGLTPSSTLQVLNNTGATNALQIQNSLGANSLTVDTSNTASSLNLISNGGAETGSPPTGWTALTNATISTGTGTDAISGAQGVKVSTTGSNGGVKVNFASAPATSTTQNYIVSFSAKFVSGTAMGSQLEVKYSADNGTTLASCTNLNSTAVTTTTAKYSCTFIPGTTTVTTAVLIMRQTDSSSRIFDVDNVSVVQQNSSGTQDTATIRVGGPTSQGLNLFVLDTYAGTPFTGSNTALAGAMYFDTAAGKMQCYDGTVWGACGAAPNSLITLTPEYAGAVLHGLASAYGAGTDKNIGTLNSDFCSNETGVLVVPAGGGICATHDARNFYSWTTVQPSYQSYALYVTYKLPSTFKAFVGNASLTGRVDNTTNAGVNYSVFLSTGSSITQCGGSSSPTNVVGWSGSSANGSANTWTSATINPVTSCTFAANNYVIFRIDVVAQNSGTAYVENLNFTYSNQ